MPGFYTPTGVLAVSLASASPNSFGVYAPDGSIRITVVPGTAYTGIYAKDGSLNVVLVDTNYTGVYHPCGAYYINPLGSPRNNGALNTNYNGGGVTPPATSNAILREDGTYLLREDGSHITREAA
jgi:hypothetical protein